MHTLTKNADGTFTEAEPADTTDTPVKLTLTESSCTLTGVEPGAKVSSLTGTNGKKSPGTIGDANESVVVNGATATGSLKATITADDATVEGFPCDLTATLNATKK